jgi:hypothetical protein
MREHIERVVAAFSACAASLRCTAACAVVLKQLLSLSSCVVTANSSSVHCYHKQGNKIRACATELNYPASQTNIAGGKRAKNVVVLVQAQYNCSFVNNCDP